MNRYLLFRRISGPVYLLTFGVTALLAQWDVLSFSRSWPLYLIVAGLLRLAENSALASGRSSPSDPSPAFGTPVAGWDQGAASSSVTTAGTGLSTVAPSAPLQTTSSTIPYTAVREEER